MDKPTTASEVRQECPVQLTASSVFRPLPSLPNFDTYLKEGVKKNPNSSLFLLFFSSSLLFLPLAFFSSFFHHLRKVGWAVTIAQLAAFCSLSAVRSLPSRLHRLLLVISYCCLKEKPTSSEEIGIMCSLPLAGSTFSKKEKPS